jgi:nicotinamide-nucleotide amidase
VRDPSAGAPLTASAGRAPRVVIVTVGDELLLGKTVDGNSAWLGAALAEMGLPVLKRYTVGDTDDAIQEAVTRALDDADVVLVTGGLGPTRDDRTRDAVAAMFGLPLHVDATLMQAMEARFRARGYTSMPASNVKQAEVPEGARVLANPQGTAPGLAIERGGRWVVLMPGVPREMKAIFTGDLKRLLLDELGPRLRPVFFRTFHTTGIAESDLAERIEAVLPPDLGPVSVAFLPHITGVDVRLTATDARAEEAERWLSDLAGRIAPVVEGYRFDAESGDVVEALASALAGSGRTLAVAESCTGGLVAKRLTDRAGSSAYFKGGVVAYANDAKTALLGVDAGVIAEHGAVSEPVALAMAAGVASVLGADAGIGVTGVAGPDGGTADKPVGTVWYAASVGETSVARKSLFPGDRQQIRERATQAALVLLLRLLEGRA